MKRDAGTARRYAEALFEVARERNAIDQWAVELGRVAELANDPVAERLFASPGTVVSKRRAIDSLAGPLSQEVDRMIDLLLEHKRANLLADMAGAYADRVREERGILRADVITAVPLDEAQRRVVAERLERHFGKSIEIHTDVDPEILGGVVARVGDQLLDGSVRGGLERLRQQLVSQF